MWMGFRTTVKILLYSDTTTQQNQCNLISKNTAQTVYPDSQMNDSY